VLKINGSSGSRKCCFAADWGKPLEHIGSMASPTMWPMVGPLTGSLLCPSLLHPTLALTAYRSRFFPYAMTMEFFGRSTARTSFGIGVRTPFSI
jgi:hypothetical protein